MRSFSKGTTGQIQGSMNKSFTAGYTLLLLFLILTATGCSFFNEDTSSSSGITITGTVVDETTGSTVPGALVRITQPQSAQDQTVTDNTGRFTFEDVRVEGNTDILIEVVKDEYNNAHTQVTIENNQDITLGNILFRPLTAGNGNGDENGNGNGNGNGVGGTSGGAASIILTGVTNTSINIAESGGIVHSAFNFQVQDSSGRALSNEMAVDIHFRITSGPNGGESLTPEMVRTNSNGQATSNLFSGNTAGVVKIEAEITRSDVNLTIRSKPILIAIHGGFPDINYFSIAANTYNFEGFDINGNRNPITVIVGDKFSNPVKPGTPVYFSTTGGIVQGSGLTDDDGVITVDLISGDPRPTDGYLVVTATTNDEDDNEISREIAVLFSASPSPNKIEIVPGVFNVSAGGGQTYTLTVTDRNDNPLPAGTSITVELENDVLTLSGDYSITVPNTLLPGPGVTQFTFSVRDNDDNNTTDQVFDITVKVATPGGFTAQYTFTD